MARGARWFVLAVALLATLAHSSQAASCNRAVLRLQPFPSLDNGCKPLPVPAAGSLTPDTVRVMCLLALDASVDAKGGIRLTPIVSKTYNYSNPAFPSDVRTLPCRYLNASGLFNGGSTTAAKVTMIDPYQALPFNLTRTGPRRISLYLGVGYAYNPPAPASCGYNGYAYNFTVTSGCFMGIKAPPKPPPCPAGYTPAKGARGTPYCAPCPPGTSSPGPDSRTCTPCPPSTSNGFLGSLCTKCPPFYYTGARGALYCNPCGGRTELSEWTDGLRCNKCPAGSYSSPTNQRQCQRCQAGVKCCTVNPSADCPKCSSGSAPPATTYASIFAVSSATGACSTSYVAQCTPRFRVTMNARCDIKVVNLPPKVAPKPPREGVTCPWEVATFVRGRRASAAGDLAKLPADVPVFGDANLFSGNLTSTTAPFLTFRTPGGCALTYRALTAPAAALLGVPPQPCPLGTPGCPTTATPLCPPGSFLDTSSTATPRPCLPCAPGSFKAAATSAKCTPCPLGYYAPGYGAKACTRCPTTTPRTPAPGATFCQP